MYHKAFEFDGLGLELVLDETFRKVIIDRVAEGGDEIVRIDGASASDLQLSGIQSLLS